MNANNPKNKVYLGNIPFTSSNNDVRAFFAGFAVKSVPLDLPHRRQRRAALHARLVGSPGGARRDCGRSRRRPQGAKFDE